MNQNFQLEGIRPPPTLLDNQVTFCQTKVSIYWSEEPFFVKNLIQFFISSKQCLNFSYFSFEIFLTHIAHSEVNAIKSESWSWKQKNKNARNAVRRSLLWNTWLWIKVPLFHVFLFLTFSINCMSPIFQKYIFMLIYVDKATLLIFDWNKVYLKYRVRISDLRIAICGSTFSFRKSH